MRICFYLCACAFVLFLRKDYLCRVIFHASLYRRIIDMNIEEYRDYCLSVKGSEECFPFGDDTLVYKVLGKVYTYAGLNPKDGRFIANMKCDTAWSAELMERYSGITFGYHSDKKYWITVELESDVPDELVKRLISHSVDEVVKKMPKSKQRLYYEM